jgi:hypothetical protein
VTERDALRLLVELGASPWLVRHHELVLEAAVVLCDRVPLAFDRAEVLVGAALHDVGKLVHPEEMSEPGSAHEAAGQRLLVERGVAPTLARFCVTHAAWQGAAIEDLLVALADKLWKGKRVDDLERVVADAIVRETGRERWAVFSELDAICESIAAGGPARLARSNV